MGCRRRSAARGPPPSSNATRTGLPPTPSRPGAPCQSALVPPSTRPDSASHHDCRSGAATGVTRRQGPRTVGSQAGLTRRGYPIQAGSPGPSTPRRSRRSPAGGKPCRLRRQRLSVKEPACGVRLVGEHLQPPAQLGDRRELGASVHHAAGDHAYPSPARSPSRRQGLTPRPRTSVNTLKPTERRPPQQRLSTRQRTCRSAASLRASPTSPSCVPQSPPVAATGITCGPFRDTAPVCDPRSPRLAPPHSATGQWALDAAPSVARPFRVTGAPQRGA